MTPALPDFRNARVLVVGDVMLDRFVWGRVERISPEAPVPVVHFTREDARPGGAGNVVSNVRALGGRAACAGLIGDDVAGRLLRETLDDLGASTAGLIVDRHRPTIEKTRTICCWCASTARRRPVTAAARPRASATTC